MSRSVDYDAIADRYDRRYRQNDYSGIERALLGFAGAAPARVLEVGCGTGHWLERLAGHGHRVTGVDRSASMLARVPAGARGIARVRARAEALPWGVARFDRVLCVNALHHFADKPAFLAEARRVLERSGGFFSVGLDPHTGLDRWSIYDYFEPALAIDQRRYPPAGEIRRWLADAGFSRCETALAQHIPWRGPARDALAEGRLDRSWTSQLSVLSDAEYEAGMARLRGDLEASAARGEQLELYADLRLYATTAWLD